jgi:hypothetical protein
MRVTGLTDLPTYPQHATGLTDLSTVFTDSVPHAQHATKQHRQSTPTEHKQIPDNKGRTFRTLALCSGRSDRRDRLTANLKTMGGECDDIEIGNSSLPGEQHSDHDILDDELRLSINKWLHDKGYAFVGSGMPCATFSAARWQITPDNLNAPRSLRDQKYPWVINETPHPSTLTLQLRQRARNNQQVQPLEASLAWG